MVKILFFQKALRKIFATIYFIPILLGFILEYLFINLTKIIN